MSNIRTRDVYLQDRTWGHRSDTGGGLQAEPSPACFQCLVCAGVTSSRGTETHGSAWDSPLKVSGALSAQSITSVDHLGFLSFRWGRVGMLCSATEQGGSLFQTVQLEVSFASRRTVVPEILYS